MALINCPECNKEISDKVNACPHCGYPFGAAVIGKEAIQKVELTSVDIQSSNPAKLKLYLIGIAVIAAIAIIAFMAVTYLNKQNKKAAFNTYIDNINLISLEMLTGASEAEQLNNLTARVWQNSIYEESDPTTDKYTKENGRFYEDFNDALTDLYLASETAKVRSIIKLSQDNVQTQMRNLQNPPEGLENCYETMTNLYIAYRGLTDLAINPTGSLTSFSQTKNEKVDAFMSLYQKLEAQIPEKK